MTDVTTNIGEPGIGREEAQLNALSEAARAITSELSLDSILKKLAEIAARLVDAHFAALGVPDGKGGLEEFHVYGMTERQLARMDHFPLGLGLLGHLLTEPESIRLDDMSKDPRSAGFCAHHPHMKSFLGVPIMSRGQNLGNLYLCDRNDGQPFTESDQRLVELLAAHAAVAIENARLSEQLQRLAVINERDRISMELHDGIIQAIYAIGIKLELTRLTLVEKPAVSEQIMNANQDLNKVIEDLRAYIRNLRTTTDHSMTLHDQIDEIAENFREVSMARLLVHIPRSVSGLTEERLHTIIQITREALSNIVRHANAAEVRLEIAQTPTRLMLTISDNGKGFNADNPSSGNGLRNIRQRARLSDGSVDIKSSPGHGTVLTVTFMI